MNVTTELLPTDRQTDRERRLDGRTDRQKEAGTIKAHASAAEGSASRLRALL